MTASEQYLREIDKAMRELHGVTVKPTAPCLHDTTQKRVAKHEATRLPGGCLLYRLPQGGAA